MSFLLTHSIPVFQSSFPGTPYPQDKVTTVTGGPLFVLGGGWGGGFVDLLFAETLSLRQYPPPTVADNPSSSLICSLKGLAAPEHGKSHSSISKILPLELP